MLAPAEKNFSPWPQMHDDVDGLVHPRLEDRLVEIAHHLVGVGVGRRIVQRQDRDAVTRLVVHQLPRVLLGNDLRHGFLR